MKNTILMASVAALALYIGMPSAQADSVRTKTVVDMQDIDGTKVINFAEFDLNQDGMFAKSEVGKALFYVFDQDGNEVIDNIEWDKPSMYTITPMEKTTYKFVDYNDDGYTDLTSYTYETFYNESGLIRFDQNKNGLSAKEFIAVGIQELDDNDNNTIELDEWEEAYTVMVTHKNAEQERYN